MAKQKIPRITSEMLKHQPQQTVDIINRVIDAINALSE